MTLTANLGYPRFGAKRELKRALESYWSGKISERDLLDAGKQLRLAHWQLQQTAGIDVIPINYIPNIMRCMSSLIVTYDYRPIFFP